MEIRFAFGGDHGRVRLEVAPNTAPVAVSKGERELGLPMCTASVEFNAWGYRSLLGWVQLLREPGRAGAFECDPFDLFADSNAPFAWYGFQPTLFDAPIGPWDVDRRLVVPLVGFAWGYEQDADDRLHVWQSHRPKPADWDGHRPYLAAKYRPGGSATGARSPSSADGQSARSCSPTCSQMFAP